MLSIERVKEIVSDENLTDGEALALRDATYALVRSILDKWLEEVLTKSEPESHATTGVQLE
jgi:hypothetical protein